MQDLIIIMHYVFDNPHFTPCKVGYKNTQGYLKIHTITGIMLINTMYYISNKPWFLQKPLVCDIIG